MADLVTVTTPGLARRYGAHGRVRLLENCIPERFLRVAHFDCGDDDPLYGYAGSVAFHHDDVRVLGGHLFGRGWQGRFQIVGPAAGSGHVLGLTKDLPGTGAVPFGEWIPAVAELDVGLVPLAATQFSEGKSWLKGMEYAAAGVPWIATATEPYRLLHAQGCGRLVTKPKHWVAAVKALRDPGLRAELTAAGREAAGRWTIERHAWRWAEAWGDAIALRFGKAS